MELRWCECGYKFYPEDDAMVCPKCGRNEKVPEGEPEEEEGLCASLGSLLGTGCSLMLGAITLLAFGKGVFAWILAIIVLTILRPIFTFVITGVLLVLAAPFSPCDEDVVAKDDPS